MNQMADSQGMAKQGWMIRLVTAVFKRIFIAFSSSGMGISPAAGQEFFYFGGFGWEETLMYKSMVDAKFGEEI